MVRNDKSDLTYCRLRVLRVPDLRMADCIYLKKSFAPGSEEHILQAALGARWKDGSCISSEANGLFAEIDSDLIDTIHPIRILLGAEGERGPGLDLKNIRDG